MAYCFGICKIFWKCLIKKQRKRDLIGRLTSITQYQKEIKNFGINGDDIELAFITRRTNNLRKDLESNDRISIDALIGQLGGNEEVYLQASSEFQKLIDRKFASFIASLNRTDQVEVLMQTVSCLTEALEKMLRFFDGWFEFDHEGLDKFIIPSNLEVERRYFSKNKVSLITLF